MGFFSEIVSETRQSQLRQPVRQTPMTPAPSAPETKPSPIPEPPAEMTPAPAPAVSAGSSRPGASVQAVAQAVPEPQPMPQPEPDPAPPEPAPQPKPEPPEQPPAIDLTPDASAKAKDDDAKRKAHEAAEAKRKAEWDVKQAKKKAARQAQIDKIAAMDTAELLAAATNRVAADTERLTRRNMKEAVAEHIQARCREDAAFAMRVMDPAKSMVHCFQYINRQAQAYAEQEMKDQGIQRTGVYGLDVPDGLCFQWAEDYFNDPDAKEDHVGEEKFIPKPYVPASAPRKAPKAKAEKKPEKPKSETPKGGPVMEQISLM